MPRDELSKPYLVMKTSVVITVKALEHEHGRFRSGLLGLVARHSIHFGVVVHSPLPLAANEGYPVTSLGTPNHILALLQSTRRQVLRLPASVLRHCFQAIVDFSLVGRERERQAVERALRRGPVLVLQSSTIVQLRPPDHE